MLSSIRLVLAHYNGLVKSIIADSEVQGVYSDWKGSHKSHAIAA